jgi:cell division protein FtsQ
MNAGEPLSTRAARMKIYNGLVRALDAGGARYSQELSEVDLSDPEDVKILASDASGEVLVHLGSSNYLQRYKTFVTHVLQWRQQFDKLESVDLRYDGQIIVNPDLAGMTRQPALTPAAAKAAMAAGVKSAAIVNYEKYVAPTASKTSPVMVKAAPVKKDAKPTLSTSAKPAAKPAVHEAAHRAPVKASAKHAPAKQISTKAATAKGSHATPAVQKTQLKSAQAREASSHSIASNSAAQKKPSAVVPKETSHN